MKWLTKVKLKDLLTEDETPEAVSQSMNAIADRLVNSRLFIGFPYIKRMREETDVNMANALLGFMYDFADERRILIE